MGTVLIVGSGGREHALGWKLAQSPRVTKIYFAPGNAGTALIGKNVAMSATDAPGIASFAKQSSVDLVVVGPDSPLEAGVVDACKELGIRVFGPTKAAAKIEWSKSYAKQIMKEEKIPTASFETFTNYDSAKRYLDAHAIPVVIKESGLALGKGVYVCSERSEAEQVLTDLFSNEKNSAEVVIESFLEGFEFSVHALCAGESYILFPPSQDHKRIFDNNKGPNTGGMGTLSPVPRVDKSVMTQIEQEIIVPLLRALKDRGTPFFGCLYPGIMVTKDGPKVIEFNARFGDPECQSYMRLLRSDLFDVLYACASGTLADTALEWYDGYAANIVLASQGYPGLYETGLQIRGIEEAEKIDGVVVFQAGTKNDDGALMTSGGRVLGVSAIAPDLDGALSKAYAATDRISYEGKYFRKDIGKYSS